MSTPETKSAIQADRAWSYLTTSLAHKVPKHLHNAWLASLHMKALRRNS